MMIKHNAGTAFTCNCTSSFNFFADIYLFQVVAIASSDLERAKAFSQKHNIPTYCTYEALAKDKDVGNNILLITVIYFNYTSIY